jgi:hypothetical protein
LLRRIEDEDLHTEKILKTNTPRRLKDKELHAEKTSVPRTFTSRRYWRRRH